MLNEKKNFYFSFIYICFEYESHLGIYIFALPKLYANCVDFSNLTVYDEENGFVDKSWKLSNQRSS